MQFFFFALPYLAFCCLRPFSEINRQRKICFNEIRYTLLVSGCGLWVYLQLVKWEGKDCHWLCTWVTQENSRRAVLAPTSRTAVDTHLTVCHTTDDVSLSTPTAHRLLIFQLVDNDESLYFELIILYCLFVLVFAVVYCLCALAPLLIVCSRARATYSHKRKCKNKHLWPDEEQYRRRRLYT